VSCVITARSIGAKSRRYLTAVQKNKPEPWRYGTIHILAPKEVPVIIPAEMKDPHKEKEDRRRAEIEASKNRNKKRVTIDAEVKVQAPNPNIRIQSGEHGFQDSDLVMHIGATTVYGQLDSKMNFIKVNFSMAPGVEYGIFQRKVKYTGVDRFKSSRLDWGSRLGLIMSIRNSDRSSGVVIANVHPGSPAERAGFRMFDHILSVDGHPVGSNSDLKVALFRLDVGKKVAWRILRNGTHQEVQMALARRFDPQSTLVEEL